MLLIAVPDCLVTARILLPSCVGAYHHHCQLIDEMIIVGTKENYDCLSNFIMVFFLTWQIPGTLGRERSRAKEMQL